MEPNATQIPRRVTSLPQQELLVLTGRDHSLQDKDVMGARIHLKESWRKSIAPSQQLPKLELGELCIDIASEWLLLIAVIDGDHLVHNVPECAEVREGLTHIGGYCHSRIKGLSWMIHNVFASQHLVSRRREVRGESRDRYPRLLIEERDKPDIVS